MDKPRKYTIILLCILNFPRPTNAEISSLWSYCGCRWNDWQAWGQCTNECNGNQQRERTVRLYTNKDGCPFKFTTCATGDMAYEHKRCNEFCYNGGTSDSYTCSCVNGFNGRCCGLEITCGDPGTFDNGYVNGETFTYGSTLEYTCNNDYMLVNGSTRRTCQLNGIWNGTEPRCAYVNSCGSNPCLNGASCSNIPDDYKCHCSSGWSGTNCEIDIQPPVMLGCSGDVYHTTAELTTVVEWDIPTFTDPHNTSLDIAANYNKNKWTFPWGDFNISYSALKKVNGLYTDCLFQIKIRPHPCPDINIPLNGAVICNNWKVDYGQYCLSMCENSYTVPRGTDPNVWFVCGASGSWIPSTRVPDCSVKLVNLKSQTGYSIAETYKNCTEDQRVMQSYFIGKLKESDFNYFCNNFPEDCSGDNTLIMC